MTTVTPHDLLLVGEQLGQDDDTAVMQRVFDRFARRTDVNTLTIVDHHWIDRTVVARRWEGKTLTATDGGAFAQRTDTGGYTDPRDITGRALLRFEYGEQITVERLRLTGPKQRTGRNRAYEAQHGIHALGVQGLRLRCVTIEGVHGDNLNGASHHRDPEQTPIRDLDVEWCNFGMSGRAGVCLNDFQRARIARCTFTDQGSTNMLHEAGRRPKLCNDLRFEQNVIVRGGSYAIHLVAGGRSRLEDVWVTNNYREGRYAFCVAVDGPDVETAGDAWPIFRRIYVLGNEWEQPAAPGKTFRFRDAADVLMARNAGPVDDSALLAHNGPPDDGKPRPYVANCTGFRSGPNALQLVGR
jgi:hypothetical protein